MRTTTTAGTTPDADLRGMPILAICRGLQVLNVARGGSLHQHVPDTHGDRITQWHAEGLIGAPAREALFSALVAAARGMRGRAGDLGVAA